MESKTICTISLILIAGAILFLLISDYNSPDVAAPVAAIGSGMAPAVKEPFKSVRFETFADVGAPYEGSEDRNADGADTSGNEPTLTTGGARDGGVSKDSQVHCFPRDRLTAEDLLPKDSANSKWAQANPAGQGSLSDQNFLSAGYHVGVNTVGSTLRNPNYGLRSEPPNPQVKVSPWMQTTIEPDVSRKPFDIGCGA